MQAEPGSKLTYEDYLKIPADRMRHEIIDGEHTVNAAPRPRHQIVLGRLFLLLADLSKADRAQVLFSPIDVQLTKHDIVQPDLVAIATSNVAILGADKIDGSPDLLVEVLSPSTRLLDRGAKRALYEATGVREYWIVDPDDNTIAQLTPDDGRYVEALHRAGAIRSTAFDGFEVEVSSIF